MSKSIRIKTLEQLKKWNENPTKELPIVLEWFMDYFFQELLAKNNFGLAKDAYDTMNRFCEICENFTPEQAKTRTFNNLNYWAGYSRPWQSTLKEFFRIYKI